jgi:tetraacyldisaccharide 4'-kinase
MTWSTPSWWDAAASNPTATQLSRLLPPLLSPLSWLYGAGVRYDRWLAGAPQLAALPSLVVGGINAGGAGKTPVVQYLVRLLQGLQQHPHIGLRGYGGVASTEPRQVLPEDGVELVGDEALLHAGLAPTWVGRNRLELASRAAGAGASQLVLDDGLQHWPLRPHLSLVVVEGAFGLGNGRLLPAGSLRESWESVAARADALLILGDDRHQLQSRWPADKPCFAGRIIPKAVPELGRVLAFAGIGRPAKFWQSLQEVGMEVVASQGYPDHYRYQEQDLLGLVEQATRLKAALITTRKDWVRLSPAWQARVAVLDVELQLSEPSQRAIQAWLQPLLPKVGGAL